MFQAPAVKLQLLDFYFKKYHHPSFAHFGTIHALNPALYKHATFEGVSVLDQKADYHLDLRGAITPITLLKATEVFRQMKCNEVLEVVGRDPDTRNDLLKVLPPLSFDLIVNEEIAEDMSYRIQVQKRR